MQTIAREPGVEDVEETYASKVRRGGKEASNRKEESGPGRSEVIVTMEGKDSKDVRREMMKEDPKILGVRVERMIKTRRGLVVALSNRVEKEKLLKSETLKGKGYVVREGAKKLPMFMIYDIPKKDEKGTLKEIWERNYEDLSEQEFLNAFKVKRKIKQAQDRRSKDEDKEEKRDLDCGGKQ